MLKSKQKLNSSQIIDFNEKMKNVYKKIRKELNAVARQYHLCCSSCASYDLGQRAKEKNKSNVVFSHRQDKDDIYNGSIPVRYYSMSEGNNEEQDRELGQKIVQIIREEGLGADWNGNPNTVIFADYIKEISDGNV